MNTQEKNIDLLELASALWKNILIIALVAVLTGTLALGYTAFMIAPQYNATASIYVNNSSFDLGSTRFSISNSDLYTSSSLVSIYLYILQSRTTMEEVIKRADLSYTPEALRARISSRAVTGTSAFEVTVTSSNPLEVELIANTVAKVLPDRIAEIVDGSSARIVDYAIIPARRSGPNIISSTIKGIFMGAVLSAGVVVLLHLLNGTAHNMIKSSDDLHAMYPDIMVLAMIPDMRYTDKKNGYYSSYYEVSDNKKGGKS